MRYVWLAWSSAFLLPWGLLYLLRPAFRNEMLKVSLMTGLPGEKPGTSPAGEPKPKTARDWRSFGAFSAFIVALFAEMYGFTGWLQAHYSGLDIYSHNAGHLWHDLLGLKGDAHLAHSEERDAMAEFGDEYQRYREATPAFFPDWKKPRRQ